MDELGNSFCSGMTFDGRRGHWNIWIAGHWKLCTIDSNLAATDWNWRSFTMWRWRCGLISMKRHLR